MAEYIDREALITKFKKMELGEHGLVERLFADGVYAVIAAFPSADVAPVVYCRECKRSVLTEFGKRYCSEPMGAFAGCIPVEDDSFCSGGKRREDAHAQD